MLLKSSENVLPSHAILRQRPRASPDTGLMNLCPDSKVPRTRAIHEIEASTVHTPPCCNPGEQARESTTGSESTPARRKKKFVRWPPRTVEVHVSTVKPCIAQKRLPSQRGNSEEVSRFPCADDSGVTTKKKTTEILSKPAVD